MKITYMFEHNTPQFWLNIQNQYNLDMIKVSGKVADISDIRPYNLMKG